MTILLQFNHTSFLVVRNDAPPILSKGKTNEKRHDFQSVYS